MTEKKIKRNFTLAEKIFTFGFLVSLITLPLVVLMTIRETNRVQIHKHAEEISTAISSLRDYYSENIVKKLQESNGQAVFTENYQNVHGGIPIPATFSIEIGNLFDSTNDDTAVEYAFVSDYTRPISELAIIAESISQGNFKTPQFTKRNDEIGLLQRAFQSMSAEISKRINDLHLLNADLEKRVRDRTVSLQLARDDLTQKIDNLRLFGAVIDKAYFGISIADVKSPGIPIVYVNPAFTKVTGHTADQTIGTKCRIFHNGITDADAMNQINLAIENKSACTVEFMDQCQNGEAF